VLFPGAGQEPDMKQINAFPLIMLLVIVLFLIAWFGGYFQ
jgi:hypothetical protein